MSLAIQQAHAVAELQQQKYMIEQAAEQQAHQLHDALQTTQAAKQTRTEFLSMMSHELRTPLACIIGMSSTLLRWSFGHLNDKQREYLTTIYDSGEHLLELIDDLLDLAELESGATQLRIAEFSLSQLARHVIRTAIDRATVNGIQLDLKLEIPAELDQFRADRARVNQILFNLLGNAIKFTLTGGRVTVSVRRDADQVVFAIEDTGIGIPQSQQASLFESFRQLEGTYTREYGGTGLGLALTKQLVELHNGTIEVQSEPDVGSCFTVSLPQANEPASPEMAIPSALRTAPHIPQGHIVLVTSRDDDATLVCDVLTAAGLQVIWMLDGSTALEQIRVLRPIVAIVDRRLDGIDGCELTSILRSSRETATLRIVMIGNSDRPEETSQCLTSGADRCITAPLNLEALLTQVIELIELEADQTAKVKVSPGQP
jgi:two-component system sensor histidine kinase/response regulator